MLSDIAEFDFDIEHIEGKRNVLADPPWIIKKLDRKLVITHDVFIADWGADGA